MTITKLIKTIWFNVLWIYAVSFVGFGFLYAAFLQNVSPKWLALIEYPAVFLFFWAIVIWAVSDGVKKITAGEFRVLGIKKIILISLATSAAIIFSLVLFRFLVAFILPSMVTAVDILGFNFFLPSILWQWQIRPLLYVGTFLLRLSGAIVLLASVIGIQIRRLTNSPFPISYWQIFIVMLVFGIILILAGNIRDIYYTEILPFRNSGVQIPISDETVNWETYQNKKLGYEIKLSPGWKIGREYDFEEAVILKLDENGWGDFYLLIEPRSRGDMGGDLRQGIINLGFYNSSDYTSSKDFLPFLIGDQKGIRFYYRPRGGEIPSEETLRNFRLERRMYL